MPTQDSPIKIKELLELAKGYEQRAIDEGCIENYENAFTCYQLLANNKMNTAFIRGEAAFQMWRIAKENKVIIRPKRDPNTNALIATPEQRINRMLLISQKHGCQKAKNVLNDMKFGHIPQQGGNALRHSF